jgi:hypothetical protein
MTESSEAAACAGIIEDIVALIRRFAAVQIGQRPRSFAGAGNSS